MDADSIIKGIVEQAIATTEKVHPGAIPIDDLARNAARLGFVAGCAACDKACELQSEIASDTKISGEQAAKFCSLACRNLADAIERGA